MKHLQGLLAINNLVSSEWLHKIIYKQNLLYLDMNEDTHDLMSLKECNVNRILYIKSVDHCRRREKQ